MDKNNLFDYSQINSKKYADKKWQKWNDDEFENTLSDINDPLLNKTKEENFFKFSCLIMNLSTSSLTLLQISSGSNKLNENTASMKASDFKNIKSDIRFTQSFNGFIEKEIDNSLADPLTLSSIILIY